jgi:hypothetical protein
MSGPIEIPNISGLFDKMNAGSTPPLISNCFGNFLNIV